MRAGADVEGPREPEGRPEHFPVGSWHLLKRQAARSWHIFGEPILLAGSAVSKAEPRDYDIRINLPDDVFTDRYGDVEEWARTGETGEWTEPRRHWSDDMVAHARRWARETHLNIDFQVYPASWAARFAGEPVIILEPAAAPATQEAPSEPRASERAAHLEALLGRPYVGAWLDEVLVEAAHQRERWGADHDTGKEPQDFFWLVGYLAGKCLRSHLDGDVAKARHHTVSTAAALVHWAAIISGDESVFRPGLGPQALATPQPAEPREETEP